MVLFYLELARLGGDLSNRQKGGIKHIRVLAGKACLFNDTRQYTIELLLSSGVSVVEPRYTLGY